MRKFQQNLRNDFGLFPFKMLNRRAQETKNKKVNKRAIETLAEYGIEVSFCMVRCKNLFSQQREQGKLKTYLSMSSAFF